MITVDWLDILIEIIANTASDNLDIEKTSGIDLNIILGASLILFGILGHTYLFYKEQKARERKIEEENKLKYSDLISKLKIVTDAFSDTAKSKSPGYHNQSILNAMESAKKLLTIAPPELASDRVFGVIINGPLDASKDNAYHGVTNDELKNLTTTLKGYL